MQRTLPTTSTRITLWRPPSRSTRVPRGRTSTPLHRKCMKRNFVVFFLLLPPLYFPVSSTPSTCPTCSTCSTSFWLLFLHLSPSYSQFPFLTPPAGAEAAPHATSTLAWTPASSTTRCPSLSLPPKLRGLSSPTATSETAWAFGRRTPCPSTPKTAAAHGVWRPRPCPVHSHSTSWITDR